MMSNGSDVRQMPEAAQVLTPNQPQDMSLADSMMAADVLATMAVNSSPCIVGGGSGGPQIETPPPPSVPQPSKPVRQRTPKRVLSFSNRYIIANLNFNNGV